MKTLTRSLILTCCLIPLMFAAACSRTAPLDRVVAAEDSDRFATWKTKISAEITPEQWKDLELAIQELKIKALADGAKGSALDDAVRTLVQGKTLRQMLAMGFQARQDRLNRERGEVRSRLEHDSRLTVREGDTASAEYLASVKRADSDRLERLSQEIEAMDAKLKVLGVSTSQGQNMIASDLGK